MPPEQCESGPNRQQTAIYSPSEVGGRLYQGELLCGVREWVPVYRSDGSVDGVGPIAHVLSVVLAQDCDLEQDWRHREQNPLETTELRNALFCPAWPADELREQHSISSKFWNQVRQNGAERYHYLGEIAVDADHAREGLPAMLVDFKSLFSVRTVDVYRQLRMETDPPLRRRARLNSPWREHLQFRFFAFQCRIGLPLDHFVPEGRQLTAVPATATSP